MSTPQNIAGNATGAYKVTPYTVLKGIPGRIVTREQHPLRVPISMQMPADFEARAWADYEEQWDCLVKDPEAMFMGQCPPPPDEWLMPKKPACACDKSSVVSSCSRS